MNDPKKMHEKYKAASAIMKREPEEMKMSACLAMGYLVGSGMEGCAAAVARLYADKYGEDNWPSLVASLEE